MTGNTLKLWHHKLTRFYPSTTCLATRTRKRDQKTLSNTQPLNSPKTKDIGDNSWRKAHYFDIGLGNTWGNTEDRQTTDTNWTQGDYFKPLASTFSLGSILSYPLPAFRLFMLEQVGRRALASACTKSALSLLHLNNKKERKKKKENHSMLRDYKCYHLQTFVEADTIPSPNYGSKYLTMPETILCTKSLWSK